MIILGVDPGTARMGYAVLENVPKKKTKLIDHGVLTTPSDMEMPTRLKMLFKGLNEIIRLYKPETVVIEKLFFNTNAKTAINVGQARGVVMLSAANKRLRVYEYTALEAKLVLTGYGRSDKKCMQEAVKKSLGASSIVKSDDANDAVAIALCFIHKELKK